MSSELSELMVANSTSS
uniref:Uncharacterized protein n=1 Tax=Anguilla anguilla TaxID=7936 RepID=A0A0E9VK78_ANGAN